jgi:hypothetical protein
MYVIHYRKSAGGPWFVLENAWGANSQFGSLAAAEAKIRELGLGGADGGMAKAVKVR